MRILPLLLALAPLALAIPLKVGGSWQWRLLNPNGHQGSRVAKVTASASHDSGTVWTLLVADSLQATKWDTALLLARPDGSQRWERISNALPWDPDPWDGKTIYWLKNTSVAPDQTDYGTAYDPDTGWIYAMTGSAEGGYPCKLDALPGAASLATRGFGVLEYDLGGQPGHRTSYYGPEWVTATTDQLPPQQRDPLLGWVRGRFFGYDWVLVAKDGQILPPSKIDTLGSSLLPGVGTSWRWLKNVVGYPSRPSYISWQLTEHPSDSLGWVRATVRQTEDSGTTTPTVDSVLNLRWNPTTGQRIPIPHRDCFDLPDGLWRDWTDSIGNDTILRTTFFSNITDMYSPNRGSMRFDSTQNATQSVVPLGGVDSSLCNHWQGDGINSAINTTTTFKLIEHNTVPLAQISRPSTPKHSLPALLAKYPDRLVRWTDLQGHRGQVAARDALRGKTGTGSILWIDATFPDGSTWKGSVAKIR